MTMSQRRSGGNACIFGLFLTVLFTPCACLPVCSGLMVQDVVDVGATCNNLFQQTSKNCSKYYDHLTGTGYDGRYFQCGAPNSGSATAKCIVGDLTLECLMSSQPSAAPTLTPTSLPTAVPTRPTSQPSKVPTTSSPSTAPSAPTLVPTAAPSIAIADCLYGAVCDGCNKTSTLFGSTVCCPDEFGRGGALCSTKPNFFPCTCSVKKYNGTAFPTSPTTLQPSSPTAPPSPTTERPTSNPTKQPTTRMPTHTPFMCADGQFAPPYLNSVKNTTCGGTSGCTKLVYSSVITYGCGSATGINSQCALLSGSICSICYSDMCSTAPVKPGEYPENGNWTGSGRTRKLQLTFTTPTTFATLTHHVAILEPDFPTSRAGVLTGAWGCTSWFRDCSNLYTGSVSFTTISAGGLTQTTFSFTGEVTSVDGKPASQSISYTGVELPDASITGASTTVPMASFATTAGPIDMRCDWTYYLQNQISASSLVFKGGEPYYNASSYRVAAKQFFDSGIFGGLDCAPVLAVSEASGNMLWGTYSVFASFFYFMYH